MYWRTKNKNMEKNELKKVCIKNRTCYYFDDIIKIKDFDFDNDLLDQKSYENIQVYNISQKTLIGATYLRIKFDKVDGFIRVGNRCLVLFGPENYDVIYNRITYLISHKSDITYVSSHSYVRITINSYDYLPLEKTLTLPNVVTIKIKVKITTTTINSQKHVPFNYLKKNFF